MQIVQTFAAVTCGLVGLSLAAQAEGTALLDGGWRLTIGPVYDMGVKANVRVTPHSTYVSPYAGGLTKEAAKAAAGGKESGTRLEFANGSWIDTDDPVCAEGDDVGKTRYYKLTMPRAGSERTFDLGSANYAEVDTYRPSDRSLASSEHDESGVLGANIELSRNLYHDADWGWGVDAGFGVNYFKHNGLLGVVRSWLDGSSTARTGSYASSLTIDEDSYSDFNWSADGSYYGSGGTKNGDGVYVDGAGNPTYAGPIKPTLDFKSSEMTRSHSSYGRLWADGDYENLELMLVAHPYYDVFDWLRINTTLGLVVSRQDLDFTMTVMRDGMTDYRSNRDFSQWDVYGIAGAGIMLYYKDFTLAADFLARFLDNDLDIDDRYVRGSVERGRWMFKLSIGYRF